MKTTKANDWTNILSATLKALKDAADDAMSYGPSEADEDYTKAIKDAEDFLAKNVKTTKITCKALKDIHTGKPVILNVPNHKLDEVKAARRAGSKAGKNLLKALKKVKKDDPSFFDSGSFVIGHIVPEEPAYVDPTGIDNAAKALDKVLEFNTKRDNCLEDNTSVEKELAALKVQKPFPGKGWLEMP